MSPCLIGMEAFVGAHHLSRKLKALGHDARLMPAKYVPSSIKSAPFSSSAGLLYGKAYGPVGAATPRARTAGTLTD